MRPLIILAFLAIMVLFSAGSSKTMTIDIAYGAHSQNYTLSFDLVNSSVIPVLEPPYSGPITQYSVAFAMVNNTSAIPARIKIIKGIPRSQFNHYHDDGAWKEAGFENVQTYSRIIDGHEAIVTQGNKGQIRYQWTYWFDDRTQVLGMSWMPWESGTKSLIETMQITERS